MALMEGMKVARGTAGGVITVDGLPSVADAERRVVAMVRGGEGSCSEARGPVFK